jgi:replicative DNA helicase
MRQRIQRWKYQHGLDLLIVDYLQKMGSNGAYGANQRVQEVSYYARSLKDFAKEFNIPVLAAAQLSRAVEQRQDKRPVLSDLRDSGEIEQEADVVMFLYRDEEYNPNTEHLNEAEIHVAKHRNGPTGTVTLYFDKASTKFHNAVERAIHLSDFTGDNDHDR